MLQGLSGTAYVIIRERGPNYVVETWSGGVLNDVRNTLFVETSYIQLLHIPKYLRQRLKSP